MIGSDFTGNQSRHSSPMSSVETNSSAQPSPFWTFSLGFYRQPGVPEACLELQDRCGVDVNVVLFLLWTATLKRRLQTAEVRTLADKVRTWQTEVVVPIRNLRRFLKSPPPLLDKGVAELFRTKIKAVELESERLQQEAMFALAPTLRGELAETVEEAAQASLANYQSVAGQRFEITATKTLMDALHLWESRERT
jgi:uncharacterized protein (TIGR02444 family)